MFVSAGKGTQNFAFRYQRWRQRDQRQLVLGIQENGQPVKSFCHPPQLVDDHSYAKNNKDFHAKEEILVSYENSTECDMDLPIMTVNKKDQSYQVYTPLKVCDRVSVLVCNRYIDKSSGLHDAEVQTDLSAYTGSVLVHHVKVPSVDKNSQTPVPQLVDGSTQTANVGFFGYSSIQNDEHMTELAGTTFENFNIFLKRMDEPVKNEKFSATDRLFIFLVKMKTGLTYSALSVLFGVHRTTISRIFLSTLEHFRKTNFPGHATVLGKR